MSILIIALWPWTEFISHCFYVAPKSIKDLVVVTVIRATGDTSAGTLISRSIIEHFGVQMFKQGLDCFPSLPGAVLLSHGGRRLGSLASWVSLWAWKHCTPPTISSFLHFRPRCNMDFSCSRPFTCTLLGFRGSASAFVSLFIIVYCNLWMRLGLRACSCCWPTFKLMYTNWLFSCWSVHGWRHDVIEQSLTVSTADLLQKSKKGMSSYELMICARHSSVTVCSW